ncbi:MAG: hypothetical protein U5L02_07260 [Rheinheimera sp.]|nr:hypothetical protein [Rheinheimera sp.]
MAIMQSKKTSVVVLASLMLVKFPAYADLKITPSLTSNVYAYGVKNHSPYTDKGIAYEINPGFDLSIAGNWLSTSLNVNNQNLVFDDAQRDNENYFQYNWQGQASFLNDALSLQVGASQDHKSASQNESRYLDEISSSDELARTESQSAGLSFNHDRLDWAKLDLNISATRSATNKYAAVYEALADTQTGLENTQIAANLGLDSGDRNSKFFWGFVGQASKIDRDVLQSQYNRRLQGVLGAPFFWRVAMIATGSLESNSELEGSESVFSQYRNRHTVGGGLEWKISDKSWWNITYNKDNDAKKDAEYIGTQFELAPSKRTSLSGSIDRRFFGRTARIKGDYKLRHLRMALNVSDTVGSVLGFGGNGQEGSLFVCPPGVTPGLDSCFQPPTVSYIPAQGEQYYNIADPNSDLNEFVVVRREVSYQIGYDFNRLKLSASIGQRKDQLVEQRSLNNNQFVNVIANWQLNARNSVSITANYSKQKLVLAGLEDGAGGLSGISRSASLTYNRNINQAVSANFNLKRINSDYGVSSRDYQENRAWVGIEYKF